MCVGNIEKPVIFINSQMQNQGAEIGFNLTNVIIIFLKGQKFVHTCIYANEIVWFWQNNQFVVVFIKGSGF